MQWNMLLVRNRNKLDQKDVAEILGVTQDTYSKKERGITPFKVQEMIKLSKHFNVPMDVLFLPNDICDTDFLCYRNIKRGGI